MGAGENPEHFLEGKCQLPRIDHHTKYMVIMLSNI